MINYNFSGKISRLLKAYLLLNAKVSADFFVTSEANKGP